MVLVYQHLMKMLNLASEAFQKPTEKSFREAEEVKDRVLQYSSELSSYIISKSNRVRKGRSRQNLISPSPPALIA